MLVFCLAAQDGGDHDSLVAGEEEPGQMAGGNKVAGGKQGGRWQTRWHLGRWQTRNMETVQIRIAELDKLLLDSWTLFGIATL